VASLVIMTRSMLRCGHSPVGQQPIINLVARTRFGSVFLACASLHSMQSVDICKQAACADKVNTVMCYIDRIDRTSKGQTWTKDKSVKRDLIAQAFGRCRNQVPYE